MDLFSPAPVAPRGDSGGTAPPPPQGPRASFLPLAAAGAPRKKSVRVPGRQRRGVPTSTQSPRPPPTSSLLRRPSSPLAGDDRYRPGLARSGNPLDGSGDPPVESAVAAPSCSPPSPVVLPAMGQRPVDSGRLCLDPATTRLDPVPPCPWGFPSNLLGGPPRRPTAVYGGTARGRPMAEGSGFARSRLSTPLALSGHAPRLPAASSSARRAVLPPRRRGPAAALRLLMAAMG